MCVYVVPSVVLCLCLMNLQLLQEGSAEDLYYRPYNATRTTQALFAAYRSALTLDWLAAEDMRQREMAAAFETKSTPPPRFIPMDCVSYPRPSPGKVARLLLELLKNLEGDDGVLIPDLIQALIKSKLLLVETSIFEAEPDFETLVKTPGDMAGEPLATFPRIMAMVWLSVTDPVSRKHGWCAVDKVTQYLSAARPTEVASNMKMLEPILVRARFIMEEFIQQVTPLNMMNRPTPTTMKMTLPVKNYDDDDVHVNREIQRRVYSHPVTGKVDAQSCQKYFTTPSMSSSSYRVPTHPTTVNLHLADENDISVLGYNKALRVCSSFVMMVLVLLIVL